MLTKERPGSFAPSRNDAAREHVRARFGTAWLALQTCGLGAQGSQRIRLAIFQAIVQCKGRPTGVELGVTSALDPALAHQRQAVAHVDVGTRVGVGAGGVVHRNRLAIALHDLAQRHLNVRAAAGHVNLAR